MALIIHSFLFWTWDHLAGGGGSSWVSMFKSRAERERENRGALALLSLEIIRLGVGTRMRRNFACRRLPGVILKRSHMVELTGNYGTTETDYKDIEPNNDWWLESSLFYFI